MRLWFLRPLNDESPDWTPWYDKAFRFVVRAESEAKARAIAANECGIEGGEVWLDSEKTVCQGITHEGKQGCIVRHLASA
jgi:hypothetical protein